MLCTLDYFRCGWASVRARPKPTPTVGTPSALLDQCPLWDAHLLPKPHVSGGSPLLLQPQSPSPVPGGPGSSSITFTTVGSAPWLDERCGC